MSPGTSTRVPRGRDGVTLTVRPSTTSGTPMPRSIRSVWSRERSGSVTLVSPSAERPASRMALFTWALATFRSWWAPVSRFPRITSGGTRSPSRAVMSAPMRRSGSTTRRTGRRRSEASPVSTESPGSPASTPASSRSEVPELPQSMTSSGSTSASAGVTITSPPSSRTVAPSFATALRVAWTSSASRIPVTRVSPVASAPKRMERWETDLSPGTVMAPRSGPVRRQVSGPFRGAVRRAPRARGAPARAPCAPPRGRWRWRRGWR